MWPYFLFLIIIVVIALLFLWKSNSTIGAIVVILTMTVFAGARDYSVGTDTGLYTRNFIESGRSFVNTSVGIFDEPGFYYVQKILSLYSDEPYVLLMSVAFIFSVCVILAILRGSINPAVSLFVFITLGYYTFCFNAMRQAIAMSIYMLAIPFLVKRDFLKYALLVFIAFLFHRTVIITLPLYFVFIQRFTVRSFSAIAVLSLIISFFLPDLLVIGASLEEKYELYQEGSATGGYLLTLFYVLLTIFFIYERAFIKEEVKRRYDVFLHMSIIGTVVYLVVTFTESYVELTRFAAYFQIASVFLWPEIIHNSKNKILLPVLFVVAVGHLGFFYIFLDRMAGLVPYIINLELL